MVDPDSNGISRVPPYLGTTFRKIRGFRLQGFHLLWPDVPVGSANPQFCNFPSFLPKAPTSPRDTPTATPAGLTQMGFRLIPFRSPLLRESRLFSFPGGTEMVHFPPLTSASYEFTCRHSIKSRFTDSGIPGSKPVYGSPGLFAVNHALHRLLAPRHSPCALSSLAQTLNPSAATFKALSRQRDNVYSCQLYDGSRKFVFYYDNLGLIFLYLPLPVVKERRNVACESARWRAFFTLSRDAGSMKRPEGGFMQTEMHR